MPPTDRMPCTDGMPGARPDARGATATENDVDNERVDFMRAVVLKTYGGPEVMEIREVPDPDFGPDEIVVDVAYSALNRADLLQRMGRYGPPRGPRRIGVTGLDTPTGESSHADSSPAPHPDYEIPGLEFSGTVAAVGRRVTLWKPGDKVFGLLNGGGYAEKIVTHEAMALPVPDNISLAEAAGIAEVFLTAYDALVHRAFFQPGERVLVHAGGSGVGTAAIQIIRAFGGTAFATVGSPEKAEGVAALGARPIQYKREDFVGHIAEATDGAGVHAVLDFVGSPYLARNMHVARELGRIVVIGLLGGAEAEIDLALLQRKRLSITGTALRSRTFAEKLALTAEFARHVLPLLADGRMRPIIDSEFPLDEVADAHRYMADNKNFGKVLLRIGG